MLPWCFSTCLDYLKLLAAACDGLSADKGSRVDPVMSQSSFSFSLC